MDVIVEFIIQRQVEVMMCNNDKSTLNSQSVWAVNNAVWCHTVLQFSPATSHVNNTFQASATRLHPALSRPKHPNYVTEQSRIDTFLHARVPRGQSVEVLAKAGFFHVGQ